MPRINPDTRLIVFSKAPRPGAVKTRLIPLLGKAGAAALHKALVEHTLVIAQRSRYGRLELHCAPDASDPFLRDCASRYGASLASQAAGDLGTRMAMAFEQALARSEHVILIGTDCPVLSQNHLEDAGRALGSGADAVFAPTEDGGYALIGLARCDARLFSGIAWGEDSVMNQTRKRLSELGWRWRELETLWDVDRPEDYLRLLALDPLRMDFSAFLDSPEETGS
jgi:rSAM/selenodomain-associated transferase 1